MKNKTGFIYQDFIDAIYNSVAIGLNIPYHVLLGLSFNADYNRNSYMKPIDYHSLVMGFYIDKWFNDTFKFNIL